MNYETRFAGEAGADVDHDTARRRKRLIIAFAVAALLAVAATITALRFMGSGDTATDQVTQAPVVTVIAPGEQAVDRVVNATGSLAARREMPVGVVGEGGMVARVLVEPGDWVKAGAPLAVIERSVQTQEARALAAQVEVARADARLADAELERAQALVARGFISKADIDRKTATRDAARARVNVALAQLREANARTGRLDIRAPAAGLVLTRNVEPGQVVGPSSGILFRLAKGGQMELLARVSEDDLARVSPGMESRVTPVGSDRTFTGQVWQVSPVIDPQSRLGMARIALNYDKALRPGGFASARIISGSTQSPLLPESAVQSDDEGNYVYIIDQKNMAVRRRVEVGQVSSEGVAITKGLTGREKVVLSAGAFLNPGQKVRPELQKAAR
ncbi:efflux RND transporter periplasmic adaptor subunit [Rhizorhapis sp. SPR117]|uniref:efflux RND transporter periplasmic adaptor subunit n=1 Tax=Rhizorhapis sp. SPR117 TaxID=2912611 RepID=UPI001F02A4B4|nr:efflux RND transporter periplasmic adaptor subunit [Rhizorhapis sp. SPR117]